MSLEHIERLENGLHHLIRRKDVSEESRAVLVDALNWIAWDDAVHIAAPWEPRSSLCGLWDRNLVQLGDDRPDGVWGCWTCLMAAEWFDKAGLAVQVQADREKEPAHGHRRPD